MILAWLWDVRRDADSSTYGNSTVSLPITIVKPLWKSAQTTTRTKIYGVAYGQGADEFGWYNFKGSAETGIGYRILVIGY